MESEAKVIPHLEFFFSVRPLVPFAKSFPAGHLNRSVLA